MATTKIDTINIEDDAITTAKIDDLAVTNGKIALTAVDTEQLAAGAVELAKINSSLRYCTLSIQVDDPTTTGNYPILISMPFDYTVQSVNYVCGNGSGSIDVEFQIKINAANITWTTAGTNITTAANTTVTSDTSASGNTGSTGDILSLQIQGSSGAPVNLVVQVNLTRTS